MGDGGGMGSLKMGNGDDGISCFQAASGVLPFGDEPLLRYLWFQAALGRV